MAKPGTTKIGPHHSCFPGNFPKPVEQSFHYLWEAASVITAVYICIDACIFFMFIST